MRIFLFLTDTFPVWILLGAILSLIHPPLFTWFSGSMITVGLGVIMLGMGLTLPVEELSDILKRPYRAFIGAILQYGVMPLVGFIASKIFSLPDPLAVGIILVASCPGGTASNVITYIARGDLALSVSMTAISTILAGVFTPFLTYILAGNRLDVDITGLFISTVQVVILPVAVGAGLNRFLPGLSSRVKEIFPFIAVVIIVLIVSSILGQGRQAVLEAGGALLIAIFFLHMSGFILGYVISRFLSDEKTARTISIEVGMQNSGLGVVLARNNFADPLTAIPSAISSILHSVLGSILAWFWRRITPIR